MELEDVKVAELVGGGVVLFSEKKYGFGGKTKVLLSSTTALDIAFVTLLKNSLSIKLIAPISMNHHRRRGIFFSNSPAAGAAGELKQNNTKRSQIWPTRKTPLPASAKVPILEVMGRDLLKRVICDSALRVIVSYRSVFHTLRLSACGAIGCLL